MATIKNLAFFDKKKLKKLNSFVESELNLSEFDLFPMDIFHSFLPFKYKFLDESFVALEKKEVKGLITINKSGEKRVKIKRLFLDENSIEIGKLLVNCIVPMYLGKGADSFYVVIDKRNLPLISMFKEGCGFADYAKENVYKIEKTESFLNGEEINFGHIRRMTLKDTKNIKILTDELINSYKRPFFSKSEKELTYAFLQNKNTYVVSYENNNLLGYFTIIKLNKTDFLLDFAIKEGFESYALDIIKYTKAKLLKKKNFKTLFFKLKSYYSNYNTLFEIFNMEYSQINENEVLVKSFYATQKQDFQFDKMIFNDITPAF